MTTKGFLSFGHVATIYDDQQLATFVTELSRQIEISLGYGIDIEPDVTYSEWCSGEVGRKFSKSKSNLLFFPILTEAYFQNDACREDYETFKKLASENRNHLIQPIYYADLVRSTGDWRSSVLESGYIDWRPVRLLDPTNEAYRLVVNEAADVVRKFVLTATPSDVPTVSDYATQKTDNWPGIISQFRRLFSAEAENKEPNKTYNDIIKQKYDDLGDTQQNLLKFIYKDMQRAEITMDELYALIRDKYGESNKLRSVSEIYYRCKDLASQDLVLIHPVGHQTTAVSKIRSVNTAFQVKKVFKT